MEVAVWITQLIIMSALIAVIGIGGAPLRDGREDPTVREEFDDLVYRARRLGSRLKRRLWRRGKRGKRPRH